MAPPYGSRLMPNVVDETAKDQPDLPFASVPLKATVADGFKNVTFSDISTATNQLAKWIDQNLGRSSSFETLAYMGVGDLRYVVVFLAAVKCGYKVLLPSLRNSAWMNASLLEQTKCSHLLFGPEVEGVIKPLLEQRTGLSTHPVPPLEALIKPDVPHYPYDKDYESAKWDPVLILHSSGSTGPPRPIVMNHATFAVGDNDRNLPTVPGRVNQNWSLWDFPQKETFYSPFPAFHLAGFSSMVMLPIYYPNATLVLGPSTRPPSGHLVSEIMDHFKLKAIFCPPIIAEQLVQEPGGLEKCQSLKFLLYAGGPLSQATGGVLSKVTDVCQFYGQTETGMIQALVPKREDWASLEWHPKQEAIMEPSIEGTFELVMHRNPALEGVRNLSCNFSDVDVWHTKDLFKPHPTKPGLWRFHGRADDIVVLSNGEKFNPVPSETQIAAHSLLAGALIVGQGRPQGSLILEPKDYARDSEALIQEVWPTVEQANTEAPAHAKIIRDMIIVGSKDKPFDRAAKGTVIRNSTTKKYEAEISQLYAADVSRSMQNIRPGSLDSLVATQQLVTEVITCAFPDHPVAVADDFFVLGLDSLQTAEVISLLKAGVKSHDEDADISWINAKLVYDHPSIGSLAQAILGRLSHIDSHDTPNREEKLDALVSKYLQNLPELSEQRGSPDEQSGLHVILTGSTGSLGIQILVRLLADPTISKITCLDRSANAKERIERSLSTWPSSPQLDLSRVNFHQADYSKADFGLSASAIFELRDTANVIIHNAWKVDFNHSVETFEVVHIRGVRNLIDFSAASRLRPRIVFMSSVSSVGLSAPSVGDPVAETIPTTPAVAMEMGYAESKAVAERILAEAAKSKGIPATVVRIGQIAGPVDQNNGGVWNEKEWFPLLLKTSKSLAKIPDGNGMAKIDWVPVDILASILLDMVSSNEEKTLQVYHVVNPATIPLADLLPGILSHIKAEKVDLQDWVAELERVDLNDHDAVASKPAVKILDFFRQRACLNADLSTEETRRVSPTLRDLGPVKDEWMQRWMKDWGL